VAREDLGEQGMDVGAIKRLGERMRRSGAQEASIAREVEERSVERQERIEREIDRDRGSRPRLRDRVTDSRFCFSS
jgi:hypothetical protein